MPAEGRPLRFAAPRERRKRKLGRLILLKGLRGKSRGRRCLLPVVLLLVLPPWSLRGCRQCSLPQCLPSRPPRLGLSRHCDSQLELFKWAATQKGVPLPATPPLPFGGELTFCSAEQPKHPAVWLRKPDIQPFVSAAFEDPTCDMLCGLHNGGGEDGTWLSCRPTAEEQHGCCCAPGKVGTLPMLCSHLELGGKRLCQSCP